MQRVPRKWAEWTVKLAKHRRSAMTLAVIYIGSDVVTFASTVLTDGSRRATGNTNTKAKKRLGSRRCTPSLTQSLTLSHVSKILRTQNSSADLAIILPAALFTRVKLAAPTELSPTDLGPTLRWAIQQQGFSPIQEWLWDAVSHPETSTSEAHWEAFLLPAAVANNYLQRLGIQQSRLARLVPDDQISPSTVDLPLGPWLNDLQAQSSLGYLQQCVEAAAANTADRSGIPPPRREHSALPVNLVCNLVTHTSHSYFRGFVQWMGMASATLMVVAVWWTQQAPLNNSSHPPRDSTTTALVTPLQPFLQHIELWQALSALDSEYVRLQHLEYIRGRWLLQIETLHPNTAGDWILQLDEELNALRQSGGSGATLMPWRVLTSASRSRQGSTIFDVEILQ